MKLVVENLSGARAGQMIFSDVSFTLENGEIMIVTGTNGSGKSTLLRVITGLLAPTSGTVHIEDDSDAFAYEHMHYLGHMNALKPALSIEENLNFWRNFCGTPLRTPDEALEAVDLAGIGHLPAAYLSAGQKRRVSIAKLLVTFKPVWVVDEPTAALDKASEQLFADLVKEHLHSGGMAIAATHKPLGIANPQLLNMDELPKPDMPPHEHTI